MHHKYQFLYKYLHIKLFWQALFTTLVTILIFIITEKSAYQHLTGFTVVTSISISGINLGAKIKHKLQTVAWGILVYLGIVFLGYMAGRHLYIIIPSVVITSWIFAMVKHYFPENWADINIPAGLIFYLAFSHPTLIDALIATLIAGIFCFFMQSILAFIYPQKLNQSKLSIKKFRISNLNKIGLSPNLNIYFIQISILLSIGTLFYHFCNYPHAYWLPFTILVVLQVSHTLTLKRIADRFAGTILGCLLGCYILIIHPSFWLMVFILGLTLFLFVFYAKKNYAIAVFFVTIFVLLLMGYQFKSTYLIVLERLFFTLLGGFLAFISSLIFLKDKQQ